MPRAKQSGLFKKVGTVISPKVPGDTLEVPDTVEYNATDTTITLTIADLNKIHVINNAAAVVVNLPSVDANQISYWIEFQKMGAGNLTVNAADLDVIADSAAGGNIANTTTEVFAFVKIGLIRATRWGIRGMLGSWTTT